MLTLSDLGGENACRKVGKAMNRSVLKNFAVQARNSLIEAAAICAAGYGVTEGGETLSVMELSAWQQRLRSQLIAFIGKKGFSAAMEEAAYTWFIRCIALRYMEVNGFLPNGMKVFSGAGEISFRLISDLCRDLSKSLPWIFSDEHREWTQLLFPEPQLQRGGALRRMVEDIPEGEWIENVQLIGWLYQYYNSEKKDRVFFDIKRNIKISNDNIGAATQIFTPEWIVRYMVENTLGRLWLSCDRECTLISEWKYYIRGDEAFPSIKIERPEDIRFIDPCMGSGHILVYAFDVLMQIYRSCGRSASEAAASIIENNLYGLDIDKRVHALSCFAVMMKARHHDPDFLKRGMIPNFEHFQELPERSDNIDKPFVSLAQQFRHADVYGSLISPGEVEWDESKVCYETPVYERLCRLYRILSRKYDVICTNPPYMGGSGMNTELSAFMKRNFADYSSDLFSAFTVRCTQLAKKGGYLGFLTPYVWMFIQSYEKMRRYIYSHTIIESLIQFEYSAFDEVTVPVCAFTLKNVYEERNGVYFRLTEFRGGMEIQRLKFVEAISGRSCPYRFEANSKSFSKIPGSPAAYWVSEAVYRAYACYPPLGTIAAPRKGNSTSDNDRFLRLWHEVDINEVNLNCSEINREDTLIRRWFPYNKGGGYRKWYGFNDHLIDWYDDAGEIRKIKTAVIANYRYFMKPGLTWSTLTSGKFSIRCFGKGYIFDNGGCCIFELGGKRDYICALLNSNVFAYIFGQLNPTLNFQSGEVAKFPVILRENSRIDELAEECVSISKEDYDSFETSWDFRRHPLV